MTAAAAHGRPAPAGQPGGARLACFPHAGARRVVFRDWQDELSAAVTVVPCDYPRKAGGGEPLFGGLAGLARHCFEALAAQGEAPLALYGHSLGALVAFEVARLAAASGLRVPLLVVSGRLPPSAPPPSRPVHQLGVAEFWREVDGWGGVPLAIRIDAAALSCFEPALRGDLRLAETYRPAAAAPLACPIAGLAGLRDPLAPPAQMEGWASHTIGRFTLQPMAGGHFFPFEDRRSFLQQLSRLLEDAGC